VAPGWQAGTEALAWQMSSQPVQVQARVNGVNGGAVGEGEGDGGGGDGAGPGAGLGSGREVVFGNGVGGGSRPVVCGTGAMSAGA